MNNFINPKNSIRDDGGAYKKTLERIRGDGVCPFCPENFAKYHKKPILRDGKNWLLTENMFPYKGARHHLLFVHKRHVETVSEMSREAWEEFYELTGWIAKEKKIRGGVFYMRFGDTDMTGASVAHLHANLISPEDEKSREPIFLRVG